MTSPYGYIKLIGSTPVEYSASGRYDNMQNLSFDNTKFELVQGELPPGSIQWQDLPIATGTGLLKFIQEQIGLQYANDPGALLATLSVFDQFPLNDNDPNRNNGISHYGLVEFLKSENLNPMPLDSLNYLKNLVNASTKINGYKQTILGLVASWENTVRFEN